MVTAITCVVIYVLLWLVTIPVFLVRGYEISMRRIRSVFPYEHYGQWIAILSLFALWPVSLGMCIYHFVIHRNFEHMRRKV